MHLIKYKFTNLSQERKLLVTIGQVFIGPISAISRRYSGKNAYTNPSHCPGSTCSSKVFTSRDVYTHILTGQRPKQFVFRRLAQGRRHVEPVSNHRLTAPPPEMQPFTRGLLFFFFMSDSLTIVNCHVISRCASESSRKKGPSCRALVSARPQRSSCCSCPHKARV